MERNDILRGLLVFSIICYIICIVFNYKLYDGAIDDDIIYKDKPNYNDKHRILRNDIYKCLWLVAICSGISVALTAYVL